MSSRRVLVLELGVGVVDRVLVVLPPDPGVVVGVGAVLLHVVAAGVAEHLRRRRRGLRVADLEHPHRVLVERVGAVGVLDAEAARLHLLEAERERAVDEAALDRLAGEEQRRGAGRAVVVDVDDRDPGQAELVERALAVGRVAVAVAGVGLLDVLVGDAGVGERLLPRLFGPVGVVALLGPGLLELGHADPDHERPVAQIWLLWMAAVPPAGVWLVSQSYRADAGCGQSQEGEEGDQDARSRCRSARWPAAWKAPSPRRVGEQDDVGRDRRREERVLDREQAEGERRGDGQAGGDGEVVAAERLGQGGGDDQPDHGPDRAQEQAVVGLVALGAHDEEDRQRDPEAVVVQAEQAVGGDADGERDAEADRVAGAGRAQGEVRAQRRDGRAAAPAASGVVGGAVGEEPDEQATRRPAGSRRRWRRAAPAARPRRAGRGPGRSPAPAPSRARRSPAAARPRSSSRRRRRAGRSRSPRSGASGC